MQKIVLKWVLDFVLQLLAKFLEFGFRVLLFLLPLGVFMTIIQFRGKVSKTSNLSIYTTDKSVWQHVFPGFILVAVDQNQFKTLIKNINNKFQNWISSNKYTLSVLGVLLVIALLIRILK